MNKLDILKELFKSGEFESAAELVTLEKRLESNIEVRNQVIEELLKGASLLRYFDEKIYENVLKYLPGEDFPGVSFEEFIQSSKLESVPRAFNTFRVKDQFKQTLLEKLKKELPEADRVFIRKLSSYYKKFGDDLDLLGIEILTNPKKAEKNFLKLFNEADEKFDLARCNDYVCLLKDRRAVLSKELLDLFEEKQQYLRARNYYLSEYHKTVFYQSRKSITDVFEDLLKPGKTSSDNWIFQLFAMGGMGKTMFVYWLISRYLVPQKIPVARIDFDFLDLTTVAKYPWLLIFVIAEQLNFQIKGSPFTEILASYGHYTPLLRPQSSDLDGSLLKNVEAELQNVSGEQVEVLIARISDALSQTEFNTPFVVILDTLERMVLHYAAKLSAILKLIERIHKNNPQMRLLLAGRYELAKRIENFKTDFQKKTVLLELRPFDKNESYSYLSGKRMLDDTAVIEAIIEKCNIAANGRAECNPFKLSLFANFYQQKIVASPEQIAGFPQTDLAYLIYRIILHIKEKDVRWLLRYAVVPREFSYDFFKSVLASHLEEELLKNRGLDQARIEFAGAADQANEQEIWQKQYTSGNKLNLKKIWESLKNYAGGYSWITFDEADSNLLRLQPDVVVPMRLLLEKEDIFTHLHTDAARYFANKAAVAENLQSWVKNINEAIYHKFQIETSGGEKFWRRQLSSLKSRKNAEVYKQIAAGILTQDFVDENGEPLKRSNGKEFIIRPQIIYEAHARFVEASISQISTINQEKAAEEWNTCLEHLIFLKTIEHKEFWSWFKGDEVVKKKTVIYAKPFDTGALIKTAKHFIETPAENEEAIEILQTAIKTTAHPQMLLSLEFMLARAYSKLINPKALDHYETALNLRQKIEYPQLNKCRIYLAIGNFYYSVSDLDRAGDTFEKALETAKIEKDFAVQQKILRSFSTLNLELGQYDKAYQLLQQVKKITANTSEEDRFSDAIFISQIYARSFNDPVRALQEIGDYQENRPKLAENAYLTELRGDISGMLMQFDAALQKLERAKNFWTKAADIYSINRCRLIRLSYLLFSIGNFEEANYYLTAIKEGSPEILSLDHKFQVELFDIFYKFKTGQIEQSQEVWRKLRSNTELSAIPGLLVQILGLGVVLNFAGSKIIDEFIAELRKIKPVSARLPLINIFQLAEPASPTELSSGQKTALKKLLRINSTGYDIIPHALFLSDIFAFCGDRKAAETLLNEAQNAARKQRNSYILKQIFSARDKLAAAAALPDDLRKTSFFKDFAAFPELCFAAYIEQADRFLQHNRIEQSKKCLASANEISAKGFKTITQNEAIYYELLGKIAEIEGHSDIASARYDKAASIFERLGQKENVNRLTGTNSKGDLQKTNDKIITITLSADEQQIISESYSGSNSKQKTGSAVSGSIADLISKDVNQETYLYQFSQMMSEDFQTIIRKLGEILLDSNKITESRLNKNFDLRLNSLTSAFAKTPWELAAAAAGSSVPSLFKNFYRSHTTAAKKLNKTIWMQLVLRNLLGMNLTVDGIFGPKTRHLWDKLKTILKLPVNVSDDILKAKIQEHLVGQKTKSRKKVLIIKAGREIEFQSQRSSGSFLDWAYNENYFSIENFSASDLNYLPRAFRDIQPHIIHIQSSFRLIHNTGEIHLDFFGSDDYGDPHRQQFTKKSFEKDISTLSPSFLAGTLREISAGKLPPLIILDAISPRSITEVVLQMFYRNVFANELFQLGHVSAIIAMGLALNRELQNDLYYPLTNSLSNAETFGAVVNELREFSKSKTALEELIPTRGIALFTNEPDLTVLSDEVIL